MQQADRATQPIQSFPGPGEWRVGETEDRNWSPGGTDPHAAVQFLREWVPWSDPVEGKCAPAGTPEEPRGFFPLQIGGGTW